MRSIVLLSLTLALSGVLGNVEEVTTESQYQKILKDNPAVVVDFYSTTCGPCIMMAPIYKDLAREMTNVKFIKVNVQTAYVGIQIRSMPTFYFYLQGKLNDQFAGAGEAQLRQMSQALSRKAEELDIVVSLGDLEKFYTENDPSKLEKVDEIYEKYPAYKLVQILKKKYGKAPEFTKKNPKRAAPAAGDKDGAKVVDIRKMDMEDLKAEVYRRESMQEEKEIELLKKKNERRRDKIFGARPEEGQAPQVSSAEPAKIVIVGGGPAGMTAAIYAARAGLKPVLIAPSMGGQLMSKGVNVENYPGMSEVSGGEIIKFMKRQALKFAAVFEEEDVLSIDLSKRPFVIKTNTSALTTHTLVIATGADSRWLGVPGEEEYKGGGISSCATCDGFLFSGKPVVVVGGGDTAMEEALVLSRTSSHVTLIHRRGEFRASQGSQAAVLSNPKITIKWNTTVKEFRGNEGGVLTTCVTQDVNDPTVEGEITADAAFVAIGHIPNTALFKGALEMQDSGYLTTRDKSTHCSVDGVFAAGDVADWVYRQAVTSAGSGSAAALDAERWLSEQQVAVEVAAEESEQECYPEDYESWSMKQIRKELKERGIDASAECRGCSEKRDFIEVLCRFFGATSS